MIAKRLLIGLLAVYAAIALIELWTGVFGAWLFIRLTITAGIIAAVIVAVYMLRREWGQEEALRKDRIISD